MSLIITLSFSQCGNDASLSPDDLTPDERIFRYDRLVEEYVSLSSFSSLQRMNIDHPVPTRLLIEDVLSLGSVSDPRIDMMLRDYYQDTTLQELRREVEKQYHDVSDIEVELATVFRKIKQADNGFIVPMIYTQVSGLNQSIVVADSLLGISLDKYLGSDYPLYKPYYYDWQLAGMNRSNIVPDALFFYLTYSYPMPSDKVYTLLDYMCNYGKFHWIIARLRGVDLSQEADFDEQSIQWYRQNDHKVWSWFTKNNALMSSDQTMVKRFLHPRSENYYLGKGTPDRIGLWVGLQIVDGYMKKHPDMSVVELARFTDYATMLEESDYPPSK